MLKVKDNKGFLEDFSDTQRLSSPPTRIALYDEIGNMSSLIMGVAGWEEITIFNFGKLEDLFQTALRHKIDFILIAVKTDLSNAVDLVADVERYISLSIIPTIIYHSSPTREQIKQGLSSMADDFVWGTWDGELFQLKVKMIHARSHHDMSINPTSQLPGPSLIEREINEHLQKQDDFAVCYLDIDDFKAYNDYRGYFYGDRTIRLVSHIIRDIVSDISPESFVGHIGGDDFIFLLAPENIDPVCSNIIKTFDRIIPFRYSEDDRNRGQIVAHNRLGERKNYGLMTISIAVLIANNNYKHLGEISHMLANLKTYTKSLKGSNYVIERRKKY